MAYTSPSFGETSGGGSGAVDSFNTRTGAVLPQAGDYTAEMVGATLTQQLSENPLTAPASIGSTGTYFVLSGSGSITIPAPSVARVLILHAVSGSSITIVVDGGNTINGQLNYQIASLESITVIADGAFNWRIN